MSRNPVADQHGKPPIHGFVLAGGRSSRMGQDKARLLFRGKPMVTIAVEKLRQICAEVSIAGNRDDLSSIAPVVHETRLEIGPGAGIEAGLLACSQPWAMFVPVDVPLIPALLLRQWAEAVLRAAGCNASYLVVNGRAQPAFCMVRQSAAAAITRALEREERRLNAILGSVEEGSETGTILRWEASSAALEEPNTRRDLELWFCNVNTPSELAAAEAEEGQTAA